MEIWPWRGRKRIRFFIVQARASTPAIPFNLVHQVLKTEQFPPPIKMLWATLPGECSHLIARQLITLGQSIPRDDVCASIPGMQSTRPLRLKESAELLRAIIDRGLLCARRG